MNILILSVKAGNGHHAAANTCREEFLSRGWQSEQVDLLKETNILLYYLVDKGYNICIKYIPCLYGAIFRRAARRHASKPRTLTSRFVRLVTRRAMRRLLREHSPDAVLCTHVLGAMAMDGLRTKGDALPPTYGLITDYDIHPFWEDVPRIERILTAHSLLSAKAARRGINAERLLPTGIPASKKFNAESKAAEKGPYRVLYMSGSMGFGHITETVSRLAALDGVQVMCVCGNNKRAEKKVGSMGLPNVEVYGFIHNVDELMDRAHCVITKPGGLSTTEALMKRLPLVLVDPIPGQEERNAEFLCGMGAAILATRDFPPTDAVSMLRSCSGRAAEMRSAAARVTDGNAAAAIADIIRSDNERYTS